MGETRIKIFLMYIAAFAVILGMAGCDSRAINNAIQKSQGNSNKPAQSPKATMYNFITRCQAGDLEGARRYFCSEMRSRMTGEGSGEGLRIFFRNAQIIDVEESYGTATVYVKIQNPATYESATIPVSMILEDGEWKISQFGDAR